MVSVPSETNTKTRIFGGTSEAIDGRVSRRAHIPHPNDEVGDLMYSWPEDTKQERPQRAQGSNPATEEVVSSPQKPQHTLQGTPADPKFQEMAKAVDVPYNTDHMRYEIFKARMHGTTAKEGM